MNVKAVYRLLGAALAFLPAAAALAQVGITPGMDKRESTQSSRIDQQTAAGNLNSREANRMERHQKGIDKMKEKAGADGTVSADERAKIRDAQRRQNRAIYRQSHD